MPRCPAPSGGGDCRDQLPVQQHDAFAQLIAPTDAGEFFAKSWQREPRVFRQGDTAAVNSSGSQSSTATLRGIPTQSWEGCLDMLTLAWGASPMMPPPGCELLVFKGRQLTHEYDWSGPCQALLDGASCVVNHAEYVWAPFTELCTQLRRELLHVYCNTYVTPRDSQAVRAHADDRDVFVLQLLGRKHWRVYANPPIPLPYPDEQVGKNGLPVPESVLAAEPLIDFELGPGDVLYMPRGFVHEARCGTEASWHATLAVATHDWTWARVFASSVARYLDLEESGHWREAVPLSLGMPLHARDNEKTVNEAVASELERLVDLVKQAATPQVMRERLAAKLEMHNQTQAEGAAEFHQGLATCPRDELGASPEHWRTRHVRLGTRMCGWTPEERNEATKGNGFAAKGKGKGKGKGPFLSARAEVRKAVIFIVDELQGCGPGEGLEVSKLVEAVPSLEDTAYFDEPTAMCLARLCVALDILRIDVQPEGLLT